jgi:hypothetical protein
LLDLERRLIRFMADRMRVNGYMGRQIYRLLKDLALEEIEIRGVTVPFTISRRRVGVFSLMTRKIKR